MIEADALELQLRREIAELRQENEHQRVRIVRLEAAYRAQLEGLQAAGGMIQASNGDEADRKRSRLITEAILAGRQAMAGYRATSVPVVAD